MVCWHCYDGLVSKAQPLQLLINSRLYGFLLNACLMQLSLGFSCGKTEQLVVDRIISIANTSLCKVLPM